MAAEPEAKRALAQFFSTKAAYIFQGFPVPPAPVIEPFAGRGDLIEWTRNQGYTGTIEAFDIMPQTPFITRQDTLRIPPSYSGKWVVTNPPFIARNKTTEHRDLYETHETNDLFKVFMLTLLTAEGKPAAAGGYAIIPLNFLCSVRPMDVACRAKFFAAYKLIRVNLFEETVFDDTTCTVIAIWFEATAGGAQQQQQTFKMYRFPTGDNKDFTISAQHKWLIGGNVYELHTSPTIQISRYVKDEDLAEGEQLLNLTFNAIDSGTSTGRIGLKYTTTTYRGEITARTYATLVVRGVRLTADQQKDLVVRFNRLFENLREEHWSLFLTNYRESKEYARKRAPFSLCYQLVNHLLTTKLGAGSLPGHGLVSLL